MKHFVNMTWKHARRAVVLVIGSSLVLLGVAAVLLPVIPGFWFIPLGLALLGTEFIWARRLLRAVKQKAAEFTGRSQPPGDDVLPR